MWRRIVGEIVKEGLEGSGRDLSMYRFGIYVEGLSKITKISIRVFDIPA
jgi:hypothetical protein